jgi:hypothetical protein
VDLRVAARHSAQCKCIGRQGPLMHVASPARSRTSGLRRTNMLLTAHIGNVSIRGGKIHSLCTAINPTPLASLAHARRTLRNVYQISGKTCGTSPGTRWSVSFQLRYFSATQLHIYAAYAFIVRTRHSSSSFFRISFGALRAA